ncbi:hypothetical protein [Micromonospora sp. NBRC 110038]|uniref:hypothetical protein n=1 Tax=Micromonospora sp. NBRC 110038 TaxID=1550034 RepID=UPI001E46C9DA|nr:hypothetical protein [Micromonospora sp. NBRC 110038]
MVTVAGRREGGLHEQRPAQRQLRRDAVVGVGRGDPVRGGQAHRPRRPRPPRRPQRLAELHAGGGHQHRIAG